jgi:hypothetical protein
MSNQNNEIADDQTNFHAVTNDVYGELLGIICAMREMADMFKERDEYGLEYMTKAIRGAVQAQVDRLEEIGCS